MAGGCLMNKISAMFSKVQPETVKMLLLVALMVFTVANPAMAADPWETANTTFTDWMSGSLGGLLALIVFVVGIFIAIAQKSLSALGWSIIMAFVIGGGVGMAQSFFGLGQTAFGS
jgi:type IV secretory pathway VirB2 component (pilin)